MPPLLLSSVPPTLCPLVSSFPPNYQLSTPNPLTAYSLPAGSQCASSSIQGQEKKGKWDLLSKMSGPVFKVWKRKVFYSAQCNSSGRGRNLFLLTPSISPAAAS